ncbi:pentapeptide repeat-containing protein [Sorangium sp. Soce836]|uniref:pentapeptide repeat-containing protein n=1 Tax=Sorangium sp. So ce836 TaxID=2969250 RepID=UPI00235048A3|nr:pentapeptide repeat-containing protein [Sorangium sp. Soce836]WCQ92562.1 hypothetical protein NQZ70_05303 [Sorangium sp. Soce836]
MITVSLTRQALTREGACSDGLALFDSIKALADEQRAAEGKPARRGLVVRWTRLHTLWAATAYPSFFGWLVGKGLVPGANLDGANLAGAYLAGAYLARANLDGANLDGANLARANLARANLDGANLAGAYLDGANLARANLAGAYLAGANLAGAYLAGANLAGANLDGAYLAGANLDGAYLAGARRRRTDPVLVGWEVVGDECDCCPAPLRRTKGGSDA